VITQASADEWPAAEYRHRDVRIALISAPWVPVPPPRYGGSEVVIDTLARGFVAAGHEVLLFTTADSTCDVPKAWVLQEAQGERIGETLIELQHAVRAYEVVRDYDIVHDHTVAGPLLCDRTGPVVTTNHGPFGDAAGDVYRAISRRAALIAISHHQASTAIDTRIARVIHHGIEPDMYPVGAGSGDYALFLGRMTASKGVHTAIRAARLAGMPLRIAAKMRERLEYEYFTDVIQPRLGRDVEYVGEVGRTTKLELLRNARCLINPIAWPEPFGMVMIEALACGTPVVASPQGAAPEIVQEGVTGFLRNDPEALATAMRKVGELDRKACRAAVEDVFSADRMVQDHLELFADILEGRYDINRTGDHGRPHHVRPVGRGEP
jgi:glycosyltransferase involved in cell wall biosynthesis